MNDTIVRNGISLFLFYLLLSSNFLDTLYSCRTQYVLLNNMLVKHFIGLFTFYISVVLVNGDNQSPLKQLGITICLYIIFIMTTRCDSRFFIVLLTLLFIGFILSKIQKFYFNEKKDEITRNKISIIQHGLYIIAIICTIMGCIIYLGRKKLEYKEKFSYYFFIFGKPNCKFKQIKETFDSNTYLKLINYAFK